MLLSVCSIMKNESQQLAAFVECYRRVADEIVIVDNGSTDMTADLASRLGCKVVVSANDFDLARNEYFKQAKGDWILSVDADELMDEKSMQILRKMLRETTDQDACILPCNQYYGDGKWATWYLARVFRNASSVKFDSAMHGSVTKSVKNSFQYCPAIIHHMDGITDSQRRQQKRERNIPLIKKQIEIEPQRPSNYNYLAQEFLALKQYSDAMDAIKMGYSLDTDKHTYATIFFAQIAYTVGLYEEARDKALEQKTISKKKIAQGDKLAPRFWGLYDLANVVLANIELKSGNTDSAIDICNESIRNMPSSAHNYINLYYLTRDQDLLRRAVDRNPYLLEEKIFRHQTGPTIYEAQSSFLECVMGLEDEIRSVVMQRTE